MRKVEVVFCVEYLLVRGCEMVCWCGVGQLSFCCAANDSGQIRMRPI